MQAYLEAAIERRRTASERLFGGHSEQLAALCHRMAERFARGGRLVALGVSPAARTDVEHVVVEFVHPVIVGKRALPALGLTGDNAPLVTETGLHVTADDIVIAFGTADDEAVMAAVAAAREIGALTLAFSELGAEHQIPLGALDQPIAQELAEVSYHVLWELVHVFFEHRGLLEGRSAKPVHDAGATAFLYPFLAEQESDLDAVLADVARSAAMKGAEAQELRAETILECRQQLVAAARAVRSAFDGGGRLLSFGNGGSCTDAADLAVDFQTPLSGVAGAADLSPTVGAPGPARPAIDLTQSSALLTALGNDIGVEALLSRQLIAHANAADVLVVFTTSGGSQNVLSGLAQARRQGLATVAFVGYDGGPILREGLADHVIVSPSQHIPRIQEAQATAYHLLRELVELAP